MEPRVAKTEPSYTVRGYPGVPVAAKDSARIRGGNWSMQGFRRSGHAYDEKECQLSIAESMAGQAPPKDGWNA
jgi:hypothetical protein